MVTLRTPPAHSATREPPERPLSSIVTRFPRAPAMLVLTIAVLALNVLTVRAESEVSAVDEREHIDHLIRASRGELIQPGHELTQETLRELCRRGSEYIAWPGCKPGRLDPADFAYGGINAARARPFYYVVAGPAARFLRALSPVGESLVTWARVLGTVWLLLGMYALIRAGDYLGISRWSVLPPLLLMAAVPIQLTASTTVTPDAMAFMAGAALLAAAFAWEQSHSNRVLWLVGAFTVGAVLLDPTNAIAGLVIATYFGLRALVLRRSGGEGSTVLRSYLAVIGVIVLCLAVGLVGWERVDDLRSSPPQPTYTAADAENRPRLDPLRDESADQGLSVERVLSGDALFALFPPVVDVAPPISRLNGPHAWWYRTFMLAAALMMVGALLLCALRPNLRDRASTLGLATAIGLVAGAAMMVLGRYYLFDKYDPVVPRVGLSALPAVALTLAAVARDRLGHGLVVAVAGGLYVTALLTLV